MSDIRELSDIEQIKVKYSAYFPTPSLTQILEFLGENENIMLVKLQGFKGKQLPVEVDRFSPIIGVNIKSFANAWIDYNFLKHGPLDTNALLDDLKILQKKYEDIVEWEDEEEEEQARDRYFIVIIVQTLSIRIPRKLLGLPESGKRPYLVSTWTNTFAPAVDRTGDASFLKIIEEANEELLATYKYKRSCIDLAYLIDFDEWAKGKITKYDVHYTYETLDRIREIINPSEIRIRQYQRRGIEDWVLTSANI